MNKIVNDTLKNKNGKWSRKSLTMLVSFIFFILTGIYIVISDRIIGNEINRYAIDVFYGFGFMAGGTTFATIADKKWQNKNAQSINETVENDPSI